MQIQHERLDNLANQGFCVVPSVLSKELVEQSLHVINNLVQQQTSEEKKAHQSLGSLISTWRDPFFIDLVTCPAVSDVFLSLGFPNFRFSNGYVFQKPGNSPPTFWHQDWWLWNDPASYTPFIHQVGLLFYLTDTTIENGCLRVIPGSHRTRHFLHPLLEQANVQELRRAENIDIPFYQSMSDEVPIPVKAGDVIIMDARLLHGAYANQTADPRTLVNFWFFPAYQELSEEGRAAIGDGIPPKEWSFAAKSRIEPYLPTYTGAATALLRSLHPQLDSLLLRTAGALK